MVLWMLQKVSKHGSDVADVGGKTSLTATREQSQLIIAARLPGLDAFTNTQSRLPLARVETEVERPRPILVRSIVVWNTGQAASPVGEELRSSSRSVGRALGRLEAVLEPSRGSQPRANAESEKSTKSSPWRPWEGGKIQMMVKT